MFNLDKFLTVKSDSSDCITEEMLLQSDSQKVLYSVIYFFTHMSSAECNYNIYNKKLLIIIHIFKKWRSELDDAAEQIQVITDYKNLEYFMITK